MLSKSHYSSQAMGGKGVLLGATNVLSEPVVCKYKLTYLVLLKLLGDFKSDMTNRSR